MRSGRALRGAARASRRALPCLVAASVLVSAGAPARATVVIESYLFERPPDAGLVLSPVYAGLRARGIYARPEQVLAAIRGALPMPVVDDFDLSAGEVMQRIDLGMTKARYGKHEEAIHLLEKALEDLRDNPAMATSLPEGPSWVTKALAGLARAHLERGHLKEAAEVIAEHVRTFPELPIDRGTYGPKLAAFYGKTREALDAGPSGKLILAVDRVDARIFINEHERGRRGVVEMTGPPGGYRVVVRVGGLARGYRVRIAPARDTVLRIRWATDAAFVVSREWLGFVWPAPRPGALSEFARRIVAQSILDDVIVLGVVRRGGHRYITARRFRSMTGRDAGGASIALGEREDAKIQRLVDFLSREERSSELLPLVDELAPLAAAEGTRWRWPMWAAGATAAGAFAAGGYLLAVDGSCRDRACGETLHTAAWGWSALGLGAAAVAFGAYHYIWARPESGPAPVIGIQSGASGGLLTLSGWF